MFKGQSGCNQCCLADSDSPVQEPVWEGPIPHGDFWGESGSSHRPGLRSFVWSHWYPGSHVRSDTVYSGSRLFKLSHFFFHKVHFRITHPLLVLTFSNVKMAIVRPST